MKLGTLLKILVVILMVAGLGTVAWAANVDFGGETVTIVTWNPIVQEFDEGGRAPGLVEEAEKLFNAKIDFLTFPHGGYPESFMSRLLAGDSKNDIWLIQTYYFWNIVAQGAFYPLSDVLPVSYYENLPPLANGIIDGSEYKGKTYGAGSYYDVASMAWFTLYNKSLLERDGLADPYQLYKNGSWTWEAMTEIAKQATRDTSGGGVIDQWGMARLVNFQYPEFMMTNDAHSTEILDDGRVIFEFDSPNALEGLRQYYQWLNTDKIIGGFRAEFAQGKVAFFHAPLYSTVGALGGLQDEWRFVPLPKGPQMDKHIVPLSGTLWVVPSNATNPQGLVEILDFLWPPEGLEEAVVDYVLGLANDQQSFEVILESLDNPISSTWDFQRFLQPALLPAMDAIFSGEKSAAGAIGEVKQELQATLDEVFQK